MGWLLAFALYALGIPGHARWYALLHGKPVPDRAGYVLAAFWPLVILVALIRSDSCDDDK